MNLTPRRSRLFGAVAAAGLVGSLVTAPAALAQAVEEPCQNDVVASARGEAAATKADVRGGAALPFPGMYSKSIFDSVPNTGYNQSGPYSLGQLESSEPGDPNANFPVIWANFPLLVPVVEFEVEAPAESPKPFPYDEDGKPVYGTPPVPLVGRSEASYPPIDGIPPDTKNFAGTTTSEAHAHPASVSGRASGSGVGDGSNPVPEGAGAQSSSAWTIVTMPCGTDTLTMVLGWSAQNVLVPGGDTIPAMSQVATMAISPQGYSVDIDTQISETTGLGVPIDGRVTDADPGLAEGVKQFDDNGIKAEAGEPIITWDEANKRLSIIGGGIRTGFRQPDRNDTNVYAIYGGMQGSVEFIAELPPLVDSSNTNIPPVTVPATPARPAVPARAPQTQTITRVVDSGGSGAVPDTAAVEQAQQFRTVELGGVTIDVTTGSFSILPFLLALLAISLITTSSWFAADYGREVFPTGGFAVDWMRERTQRFKTSYLRW